MSEGAVAQIEAGRVLVDSSSPDGAYTLVKPQPESEESGRSEADSVKAMKPLFLLCHSPTHANKGCQHAQSHV